MADNVATEFISSMKAKGKEALGWFKKIIKRTQRAVIPASTGRKEILTERLWELGINENEGMIWYRNSLKDGNFDEALSKGKVRGPDEDLVRGATKALESYDTTAEATESNGLTAFNNNGFTIGTQGHYNGNGFDMASWTFRK